MSTTPDEARRELRGQILKLMDAYATKHPEIGHSIVLAAVGNAFTSASSTLCLAFAELVGPGHAIQVLDHFATTVAECMAETREELVKMNNEKEEKESGQEKPKDWNMQ